MTNFIEAASTSIYNPNLTYNALGDGSIYQTVKELPAGKYMLACNLHNTSQYGPNPCTGTYLFAENCDVSQEMEIHNNLWIEHVTFTFVTTGGDVTLGMKTRNSTANWIAIDNITLTYYGEVEVDPEKANLDAYIATCEERYPAETFEDVIANQNIKDSYQQALENAKNATENYQDARSGLEQAIGALDNSIEEYKNYKRIIDGAYRKCAEFDDTKWVQLQDQLYDYLMECLNASATGFLSRLDAGISKQTYSVTDYLTGQHYRIRVGASDADTAFTVSMVLAVKLANAGILWIMPWCGTSPTAKPIIPEKYCNGSMRFAGRKTDERE